MRFRNRKSPQLALGLAAVALFATSCTGGSDPEAAEALAFGDESTEQVESEEATPVTGSSSGVEDAGLDGVEGLWRDAGASPDLAACYRSVLEEAGVDTETEIKTLEDVVAVQEALTDRQQDKFNNCLNESN